jgi:hypothetical protein
MRARFFNQSTFNGADTFWPDPSLARIICSTRGATFRIYFSLRVPIDVDTSPCARQALEPETVAFLKIPLLVITTF